MVFFSVSTTSNQANDLRRDFSSSSTGESKQVTWPLENAWVQKPTEFLWFQYMNKTTKRLDRLLVYLIYLEYQRLMFDCRENFERSCVSGPNRTPVSHACCSLTSLQKGSRRMAKVRRWQLVPKSCRIHLPLS